MALYRGVGHELLYKESPVVEVIVHPEVARLIDVTKQPCLFVYVTHSVRLCK